MKFCVLLIMLSSLVIAEETFIEEMIGVMRPLFIMATPFILPIAITLLIVAIVKFMGKGASLTADLFKDDDEHSRK